MKKVKQKPTTVIASNKKAKGKVVIITMAVLVVMATIVSVLELSKDRDGEVVSVSDTEAFYQFPSLQINGQEVEKEEYDLTLQQQRHAMVRYFMDTYQVMIEDEGWDKEIKGEYPYQVLSNKSIEALQQRYAIYLFAMENQYIEDLTYAGIEARMNRENKKRDDMVAKGEVVYGLSKFSYESYIVYEIDSFEERYYADTGASEEQYQGRIQEVLKTMKVEVDNVKLDQYTLQAL